MVQLAQTLWQEPRIELTDFDQRRSENKSVRGSNLHQRCWQNTGDLSGQCHCMGLQQHCTTSGRTLLWLSHQPPLAYPAPVNVLKPYSLSKCNPNASSTHDVRPILLLEVMASVETNLAQVVTCQKQLPIWRPTDCIDIRSIRSRWPDAHDRKA